MVWLKISDGFFYILTKISITVIIELPHTPVKMENISPTIHDPLSQKTNMEIMKFIVQNENNPS